MKNYEEFNAALKGATCNTATQKLVDGVETLLDHYDCRKEFEEFIAKRYQDQAISLFYYDFLHKQLHKDQQEFAPIIGFGEDDAREYHDSKSF